MNNILLFTLFSKVKGIYFIMKILTISMVSFGYTINNCETFIVINFENYWFDSSELKIF